MKNKGKQTKNEGKMKGMYVAIGLSVVALLFAAFTMYMQIQGPKKMAFVNSQYLISNYEGFKDASLDYQRKASQWQANIDTLSKELETRVATFEKEKASLSANEKKLSEELIQTKQQQLMQYQQGIRQKAQQEDQEMTAAVIEEINVFLKDYGKKHGYHIVFGATDAGNIVYAEEPLNITEAVLEAMNKQYRGE